MLTPMRLSVFGPGKQTVSKSVELPAVAAFASSAAVPVPGAPSVAARGAKAPVLADPPTVATASECSN